jgi:hypothetical protein
LRGDPIRFGSRQGSPVIGKRTKRRFSSCPFRTVRSGTVAFRPTIARGLADHSDLAKPVMRDCMFSWQNTGERIDHLPMRRSINILNNRLIIRRLDPGRKYIPDGMAWTEKYGWRLYGEDQKSRLNISVMTWVGMEILKEKI